MTTSRISELATIIAASTAALDAAVAAQGLPSPSFSADSPPNLLSHQSIAPLRQRLLEATDELHALMLGPAGLLIPTVVGIMACHAADWCG